MKPPLFFLASHAALAVLGLPAMFHPMMRRFSAASRVGAAFASGVVLLTLEGMLLSALEVPWTPATLALPLPVSGALLSATWAMKPAAPPPPRALPRATAVLTAALAATSVAALAASLATSGGTSADMGYIWGAKAVHFTQAQGLDPSYLASEWDTHAVPSYPPLVPISLAWSVLVAREMPWRAVPLLAVVWLAAAVPLLFDLLRQRMQCAEAAAVTAFWTVAIAASLGESFSGGNAEAPLLFFVSVAGAALLADRGDGGAGLRTIAACALAGAVLTKVEGSLAAILLLAGTTARDLIERRDRPIRAVVSLAALPVTAVLAWFAFQWHAGLPVGFRQPTWLGALDPGATARLVVESAQNMGAGTFGASWLLPAAVLAARWRRSPSVLPALVYVVGLLALHALVHLRAGQNLALFVHWNLPRISQPALSLTILAAGLVSFGPANPRRAVVAWESPEP
jgi:hypothetical protein